MQVAHQRGTPVIYVAASARELPAEVQDWLGRADIRAVASHNIYDLLAELVRGRKFAALVVNIQSVDWNEMDFFDHAAKLARHTPIYVTGSPQQRAKLEAACRRGAQPFDAMALDGENAPVLAPAEPTVTAEPTLAAEPLLRYQPDFQESPAEEEPVQPEIDDTRQPSSTPEPTPSAWPRVRLAEAFEPATEDLEELETGFLEDDESSPSELSDEPEDPIEDEVGTQPDEVAAEAASTALMEQERITSAVIESQPARAEWTVPQKSQPSDESDCSTPQQVDTQPRIAVQSDHQADAEAPVVFPWTTTPSRPKRTPPQHGIAATEPMSAQAVGGGFSDSPFKSVRLTAEEIAALMGQPPRRQAPEAQP